MKQILLTIFVLALAGKSMSQERQIEANRFLKIKDGRYGITDSLGSTVVPFTYDHIDYKGSRLIVRKKELHGLLSLNNDVILPVTYSHILPRAYNRFMLWAAGNRMGLCDMDGNLIIPVTYKTVSSTDNDDYYITKNEQDFSGVYSYTGEKVFPE